MVSTARVTVFMDDSDPLSAALKQTFASPSGGSHFPAAQNMIAQGKGDLNKDIEDSFFGGGQGQGQPTPTPTPVKPTQMNLSQLYEHFGVPNPVSVATSSVRPIYQNKPDAQVYNWKSKYGWSESQNA